MRVICHKALALIAAVVWLLNGKVGSAAAQQTLFNVPSSDVLDRAKFYAEIDASFKPIQAGFTSFVPRIVAGLGCRIEAGLNITGNIQPGPDKTTLVPTIKWMAYDGGANGWAFVAGDNLFIPVRNRSYTAGNYAYAQVSKTFNDVTRFTAGAYTLRQESSPRIRSAGAGNLDLNTRSTPSSR